MVLLTGTRHLADMMIKLLGLWCRRPRGNPLDIYPVSLIFGLVWSPLKTFVVLIRNQASQLAYSWEDDEYKLSIL